MSFARYGQVVTAVAGSSLALLWPLGRALGPGGWAAAAGGALLAVLNTLAAYGLVRWTEGKSTVFFFRAILGGILIRMALLLSAFAGGLLLARLSLVPFVVSLLGHYIVFLGLETAVLARMATPPPDAR